MYDRLFTIGTLVCLAIVAAAIIFGLAAALFSGSLTLAQSAFSILVMALLLSAIHAVWKELREQ